MKSIGDPLDRVDGRAKVTGQARYAVDVPVARVVHAHLLVSTIAKGRIDAIDTRAAVKAPGVLLVLTHENAPALEAQPDVAHRASMTDRHLQVFQDDVIHYSRQPVAVVVADTRERAEHAASLIAVRYTTEAPASTLTADAEGEKPTIPAKAAAAATATPPDTKKGDLEKGLAAAAVRVDQQYTMPHETHNPMEAHGTIAVWNGPQHLTVYDSTQGIFEVQRKLSVLFGLPKKNVHVISHYIGGGFGCKGSVWSHVAIAALAAKQLALPVKLAVARDQMFGMVGFRPGNTQHVVLAAEKDGTLTAIHHEGRAVSSRFDEYVEHVTAPTRALYQCDNVVTSERIVKLDIGTPTFMRAPGESTGNFAIESAMDELSYALGMDPIELRLKNHADVDPETGKPWSSKSLKECYRRAAEKIGWARRDPKPRAMRDGRILIGMGMATATYPAHLRPASAEASLLPDGSAQVRAGSQDIGTGTYTVMTQVAANGLGIAVDKVQFDLGDTDMPETPGSGGSTTAASVGSAVYQACVAVRVELALLLSTDLRSPLKGVVAEDLRFDGDVVSSQKDPSRKEELGAIFDRHHKKSLDAKVEAKEAEIRKKYQTRAFGAQFVEVRVDPDLGEVRVSRAVGAFAAGRILNAKTAHSQFMGGMVWGIGMGLLEQMSYDPRFGRVMNADLADYLVPINRDIPALDIIMVDEEDPYVNEIGVKGIGEIGITGMAAALANAIFHATGKRIRDLPITVDKLVLDA